MNIFYKYKANIGYNIASQYKLMYMPTNINKYTPYTLLE